MSVIVNESTWNVGYSMPRKDGSTAYRINHHDTVLARSVSEVLDIMLEMFPDCEVHSVNKSSGKRVIMLSSSLTPHSA